MAQAFPLGGIILWPFDAAKLKSGWQVCNGSNSTPDLRGRFIKGAATAKTAGIVEASNYLQHDHSYSKFPETIDKPVICGSKDTPGDGIFNADPNATTTGTQMVWVKGVEYDQAFNLGLSKGESRPSNIYLHYVALVDAEPEEDAGASPLPVGAIIPWIAHGNDPIKPPAGWLICDGQPCSAECKALADLLQRSGSPFGKTGTAPDSVPNVPNLCGRFVRGVVDGDSGTELRPSDPDLASRVPAGKNNNSVVGSIQNGDIACHSHGFYDFPGPETSRGGYCSNGSVPQATHTPAQTQQAGSVMVPANVSLIHLIKGNQLEEDVPPPVGSIVMYAGGSADSVYGWLHCDGEDAAGRLLDDMANCPDLTGLFVRGVDDGPNAMADVDRKTSRFMIASDEKGNPTRELAPVPAPLSYQFAALQDHGHIISMAVRGPQEQFGVDGHYGNWISWPFNSWEAPTATWSGPYPISNPNALRGIETRPENMALHFIISKGLD